MLLFSEALINCPFKPCFYIEFAFLPLFNCVLS
uniref:Uncharacterized protein n=1 Tax=Anguilla anguilla TaxID=7936 RepID=A0A0E9SH27_ANGAN